MILASAFWLFLLCACLLIWTSGNREARFFTILTIAASISTSFAMFIKSDAVYAIAVSAIDTTLWVVALVLVARSRAYWPIWFAGFQSITVATELARQLFPAGIPAIFGHAAALWAIPALAAMTVGVLLDSRARQKRI